MKIINFILYGNVFIALCAYAQTLQTCLIFGKTGVYFDILPIFIAVSTFFLYNIHKPITYLLKKQLIENQRILKTKSYSTPLSILTIIGGILCFFLFFSLKLATQYSLVLAALLSLAYVLPVFGGQRLRDLPFIKIFTIAFVWAFVTVILPIQEYEQLIDSHTILLFLEKTFFIFALTIPFDIRDMDWDARTNVKTIPLSMGIQKAKLLSILSLLISVFIIIVLKKQSVYSLINTLALLLSYAVSIFVIMCTQKDRNDYFFYGLTDGMLIFQSFCLYMLKYIL